MEIFVSELKELPKAIADLLFYTGENRKMVFFGGMGSGKTTIIKELCKQLGVTDNVASPTFSIINEYHTNTGEKVFHFDFYRINNIDEVYDLGYEDYFFSGDYCFIEWPEKIEGMIPDDFMKVIIEDMGGEERLIKICV
jgi:tRNA threonylcarbamoyladenosine biosynthesis protein TsaE